MSSFMEEAFLWARWYTVILLSIDVFSVMCLHIVTINAELIWNNRKEELVAWSLHVKLLTSANQEAQKQ